MVEGPGEAAGSGALRPLNRPHPVAVECSSGGLPRAVLWRGRMRPVTAVHDSWRIDDEWWRSRISRRYFQITCEGERQMTVYCDLLDARWYVQAYPGPEGGRP